MFDGETVLLVVGTFLLAGAIKGVIGLGLPTVSLALLTVAIGLPQAMALLLVPSFVTNLWQALVGGNGMAILRRLWPFLLLATGTVWIGAMALTRIELSWLSALLGLLLMIYATVSLAGYRLAIGGGREGWVGTVAGAANGVLTGMTGSFVVPGVMFLQAIGLPRDTLVQAMGILFTASTVALGLALQGNSLLTPELGGMSAAALLPALAGMVLGQKVRRRLPEKAFQRVFFVSLLLLGGYILVGALTDAR